MVLRLQLQLGAPPVTALAVVADGVAGPHTDPLGHRSVLLQLLAELLLDAEGLQGRLEVKEKNVNFTKMEQSLKMIWGEFVEIRT